MVAILLEPHSLDRTLERLLEAYAGRGMSLVDVTQPAPRSWQVRLDLDLHRLHLRVSDDPAEGLMLELCDAVICNELRYPGIIAAVGSVGNALQKRIAHLRCLYTPINEAGYDLGAGDGRLPYPTELLVTLQFGAPLLGATEEQLLVFCELGIDTLFYAFGILHDDLLALGFPIEAPLSLD